MSGAANAAAPASGGPVDYVAVCDQYLPLVKHAVSSYAFRLPGYVDVDDLTGAAILGLVEAARRFDAGRGVPFEAWALQRIRGAILDAARSADAASRRTRSDSRRVEALVDELAQRLGRRPTEQEIARELGMSRDELAGLRAKVHAGLVVSLDASMTDADGSMEFSDTLVDADLPPLESLERRELDAYVHDCVAVLPDRLRYLITEYFFNEKTSADLAEEMGVTESRVSQLRTEALRLLREALGAQYEEILLRTAKRPGSGTQGGGLSAKGAEVAKAAAARSTYAERLSASPPKFL